MGPERAPPNTLQASVVEGAELEHSGNTVAKQAGGSQLPSTSKPGGTLVGMPNPSTLLPGDRIQYNGKCHTIIAIKSWPDQIHGTVYALDLEAQGKQVRISVVEGAELEGC